MQEIVSQSEEQAAGGELGLGDAVTFHPSSVSTYYDGHLYPMMTPLDLLRFTPLRFHNRIRLAPRFCTSNGSATGGASPASPLWSGSGGGPGGR